MKHEEYMSETALKGTTEYLFIIQNKVHLKEKHRLFMFVRSFDPVSSPPQLWTSEAAPRKTASSAWHLQRRTRGRTMTTWWRRRLMMLGKKGELDGGWIFVDVFLFFPTCQLRVVRFYVNSRPPPPPQLPAPDGSLPHQTSTASARWQWSPPDLNRQLPIAVFLTGPQPSAQDGSVPLCQIEC